MPSQLRLGRGAIAATVVTGRSDAHATTAGQDRVLSGDGRVDHQVNPLRVRRLLPEQVDATRRISTSCSGSRIRARARRRSALSARGTPLDLAAVDAVLTQPVLQAPSPSFMTGGHRLSSRLTTERRGNLAGRRTYSEARRASNPSRLT